MPSLKTVSGHRIAKTVNFAYVSPASILTREAAYRLVRHGELPPKKKQSDGESSLERSLGLMAPSLLYQRRRFISCRDEMNAQFGHQGHQGANGETVNRVICVGFFWPVNHVNEKRKPNGEYNEDFCGRSDE